MRPSDLSDKQQTPDEEKIKSLPPMLIAIDGPAGAGKTTVSRMLARRLRYQYLDTGALYRGVAVAAGLQGLSIEDEAGIAQLCRNLSMKIDAAADDFRLVVNGRDVTDLLRTPEITMLASALSALPVVRQSLLEMQQHLGRGKRMVAEGRDMGTVVFPDADIKFFLDADLAVRAERRYEEMADKTGQSLDEVRKDMKNRDEDDSSRDLAPLKPAEDAVRIDSTDLGTEVVVNVMLHKILEKNI